MDSSSENNNNTVEPDYNEYQGTGVKTFIVIHIFTSNKYTDCMIFTRVFSSNAYIHISLTIIRYKHMQIHGDVRISTLRVLSV